MKNILKNGISAATLIEICLDTRKTAEQQIQDLKEVVIPHMRDTEHEYEWISVEDEMPDAEQKVYIVCQRPKYGGGFVRYQTIAVYIPYMTVPEDDFMDDQHHGEGDYNKSEDKYYTPEGFYEYQFEADVNYRVTSQVTHFKPLMQLP